MAWIISIVLFGITSVCAGFYSGNWRNIQNTPWRLFKKIYDTYIWCVILIYIGWRMQGWWKGQSHILKTAIMVPRKRLSRAIPATFWPHGRRALRALRPRGPNVKNNAPNMLGLHTCSAIKVVCTHPFFCWPFFFHSHQRDTYLTLNNMRTEQPEQNSKQFAPDISK